MSYTTVVTATVDAGLVSRVNLALQSKAYARVDNVANGEDQRELQACQRVLTGIHPTAWATLVLLVLDANGTLVTATDAEINTAVNAAWNRIKLVG